MTAFFNRIKFLSTSISTGAFQPGAAIPGYRPASVVPDGTPISYIAETRDNASNVTAWETGHGTYHATGGVSRDTPLEGSSTLPVNFATAPTVWFDYLAQDLIVNAGLADAPSDGTAYGRMNSIWTHVVRTAGDTMSGLLTLSGDPTTGLQAATKQYVDVGRAVPVGFIGLTLSNDSVTPATILDIAHGGTVSDDYATWMILPSNYTKACNAAWAVGSGQGALDVGATLNASTWYHVFLIMRLDTGIVDILLSQQASNPTLPANYTKKRRLGSIKTDASAHVLAFTQFGDEFLWTALVAETGGSIPTAKTLLTLAGTPTGIKTLARIRGIATSAGSAQISLSSTDDGGGPNIVVASANAYTGFDLTIRTNTIAQINWLSNIAATMSNLWTYGWVDLRGK